MATFIGPVAGVTIGAIIGRIATTAGAFGRPGGWMAGACVLVGGMSAGALAGGWAEPFSASQALSSIQTASPRRNRPAGRESTELSSLFCHSIQPAVASSAGSQQRAESRALRKRIQ
jgi:hypothetical protein